MTDRRTIAIVGGTGALGSGLARRWLRAGHAIVLGSREAAKADAAARALGEGARGLDNRAAAEAGEIVVLTVPYASHDETLAAIAPALAGKILVDTTVPLVPPRVRTVTLPPGGSVAKAAQERLGEAVRVVAAFQNVAAAHLADPGHAIDCDVLVTGNDPAAREAVVQLAADAGLRAWHAGRIDNAVVAETLTAALIFINHHHRIDGAGLRITGEPGSAPERGRP